MPKVLIGPAPLAKDHGPFYQELLAAGFEPVYPPRQAQMNEDELLAALADVPAVLAGSEPYSARVFSTHPQLRIIARVGVGYDAVDTVAATAAGAAVAIAPGTNQESVAEHTFMLMLAVARSLVTQHNGIVAGGWPRKANQPLRGRTLSLVGLGRIGRAVAERGLAFGMNVIAYDPYPDHEFLHLHGIPLVSFEDALRHGDYVSLHMPLNDSTRQLINARTLAHFKPTAYLINTARGGLVHEPDLLAALQEKRLAGAGLDVFDQEPPGDNPLLKLDNVVATAHTAGVDAESLQAMALSAARAIVDLARGEWPGEKIVNPDVQGKFRWDYA